MGKLLIQKKGADESIQKHPISIFVPGSKSQSNRALILAFLAKSSHSEIQNLSTARDTQLLNVALQSLSNNQIEYVDFCDAGTPARLFLGLCSAIGKNIQITGNESLKSRSMMPLIQVLSNAGAEILSLEKEGYLPLQLRAGLTHFPKTPIDRTISSQFVTSLMLVAPLFEGFKTITLQGQSHSDEYIEMTRKVLNDFGIRCTFNPQTNAIVIGPEKPIFPNNYTIECDWSGAGYFLALAALGLPRPIVIQNLSLNSCQGDAKSIAFWKDLGIRIQEVEMGIECTMNETPEMNQPFHWDLSQIPDMAPTLIVTAALKGLNGTIHGIENLKFKECNRIDALNGILQFVGYSLIGSHNEYRLTCDSEPSNEKSWQIQTHSDHRMAMVGALLATKNPVEIDDSLCIEKSYPTFWEELQKCNFELLNYGAQ